MVFRDGVVISINPVDGIMLVEVSNPFVVASTNLRSTGACRSQGSFLFEPFFHYPALLPHVAIPGNLERTDISPIVRQTESCSS